MSLQIIPILENEVRFDVNVTLEETEFIFFFDWNNTEEYWYLTVKKLDETYVRGLVGIKIVVNWPLNRLVNDVDFPNGILFAMNQTNTDPVLNDLKLVYCTQETWEEIQSENE